MLQYKIKCSFININLSTPPPPHPPGPWVLPLMAYVGTRCQAQA